MQISGGGIGNGLYQEVKGCRRNLSTVYALKNLISQIRDALSTCNMRTRTQCVYTLWINICFRRLSLHVFCSPPEITPLVKATASERVVGTVILLARPVFGAKKLAKGCDCDDGAAAEERGCNVLPECRILQNLHFTACQLR